MTKLTKSITIITSILVLDQIVKIWIKTHMTLGQEFSVFGNWFLIHFVENNGMAFGFEFAVEYGKIFLTLFRIAAVIAIGWYMLKLIKKDLPMGFIACVSLILAGASGNIFDSVFYGVIFNDSHGQIATMFPDGGGYASFLHGKVVDMLYFPMINGRYPEWLPFKGGDDFQFFRPVFNIADSSITIGIFSILIFYRKLFSQIDLKEEKEIEVKPDEVSVSSEEVTEN